MQLCYQNGHSNKVRRLTITAQPSGTTLPMTVKLCSLNFRAKVWLVGRWVEVWNFLFMDISVSWVVKFSKKNCVLCFENRHQLLLLTSINIFELLAWKITNLNTAVENSFAKLTIMDVWAYDRANEIN